MFRCWFIYCHHCLGFHPMAQLFSVHYPQTTSVIAVFCFIARCILKRYHPCIALWYKRHPPQYGRHWNDIQHLCWFTALVTARIRMDWRASNQTVQQSNGYIHDMQNLIWDIYKYTEYVNMAWSQATFVLLQNGNIGVCFHQNVCLNIDWKKKKYLALACRQMLSILSWKVLSEISGEQMSIMSWQLDCCNFLGTVHDGHEETLIWPQCTVCPITRGE